LESLAFLPAAGAGAGVLDAGADVEDGVVEVELEELSEEVDAAGTEDSLLPAEEPEEVLGRLSLR
jgi:hypothetical protein